MPRVLVLFAHPALEKSRIHRRLLQALPDLPEITLHDLYEHYPSFNVDVAHEQALLLEHEIIVMQHPLYWYSAPPLLKQWIDLVLAHGWAYGMHGDALRGKQLLCLISAGGPRSSYSHDGFQGHTLDEFLLPISQTARLCKMEYLPSYAIYGTHRLSNAEIGEAARAYRRLLEWLVQGMPERARVLAQGYAALETLPASLPEVGR